MFFYLAFWLLLKTFELCLPLYDDILCEETSLVFM